MEYSSFVIRTSSFGSHSMHRKLLVLGIGNLLMGDEGVGVHAVRLLERQTFPPFVSLVDGGTGGFHLLSLFDDYGVIVLIDATMDGKQPGTISHIRPRFASDFPRSLSAHDIGLRDLIESAQILHPLPPIHLITVSIERMQPMVLDLSPRLAAALPEVATLVRQILDSLPDSTPPACYPMCGINTGGDTLS